MSSPHDTSNQAAAAGCLRALVVDDHPVNARVLTVLLQQMGIDSEIAVDGAAAVLAVAQGGIDVVFMDYHMPRLDGFEATRQIRQLPMPLRRTPVVLVTADVSSTTQHSAASAGVDAFIAKPVRIKDLKDALAQALNARAPSRVGINDPQPAGPVTAHADDAGAAAPPTINHQVFQELRELIAADQWQIMLDSLFCPDSGDVDVLLALLRQGTRAQIGDQAHKLKGATLLMGLTALGAAAAELEHLARRSDSQIAPTVWTQRLQTLARDSHQAALERLQD